MPLFVMIVLALFVWALLLSGGAGFPLVLTAVCVVAAAFIVTRLWRRRSIR
jgi:hypothetical protein